MSDDQPLWGVTKSEAYFLISPGMSSFAHVVRDRLLPPPLLPPWVTRQGDPYIHARHYDSYPDMPNSGRAVAYFKIGDAIRRSAAARVRDYRGANPDYSCFLMLACDGIQAGIGGKQVGLGKYIQHYVRVGIRKNPMSFGANINWLSSSEWFVADALSAWQMADLMARWHPVDRMAEEPVDAHTLLPTCARVLTTLNRGTRLQERDYPGPLEVAASIQSEEEDAAAEG